MTVATLVTIDTSMTAYRPLLAQYYLLQTLCCINLPVSAVLVCNDQYKTGCPAFKMVETSVSARHCRCLSLGTRLTRLCWVLSAAECKEHNRNSVADIDKMRTGVL